VERRENINKFISRKNYFVSDLTLIWSYLEENLENLNLPPSKFLPIIENLKSLRAFFHSKLIQPLSSEIKKWTGFIFIFILFFYFLFFIFILFYFLNFLFYFLFYLLYWTGVISPIFSSFSSQIFSIFNGYLLFSSYSFLKFKIIY
jgi:hypothetical protein